MRETLLESLRRDPDDWLGWSALADLLEEEGDPLAACVRWMVRHRKRPRWSAVYRAWCWYDESKVDGIVDRESDLPTQIYLRIDGGAKVPYAEAHYPRLDDALSGLARALEILDAA